MKKNNSFTYHFDEVITNSKGNEEIVESISKFDDQGKLKFSSTIRNMDGKDQKSVYSTGKLKQGLGFSVQIRSRFSLFNQDFAGEWKGFNENFEGNVKIDKEKKIIQETLREIFKESNEKFKVENEIGEKLDRKLRFENGVRKMSVESGRKEFGVRSVLKEMEEGNNLEKEKEKIQEKEEKQMTSYTFTRKKMKEILDVTNAGIVNSETNPMVVEKVGEMGYTLESLAVAKALRASAEGLYIVTAPKTGEKMALTAQVIQKIDAVYKPYMVYQKLLRRDLSNNPVLFKEFNLSAPRDNTLSGKLLESKSFFSQCVASKKIGDYVLKYGLTKVKAEGYLADIASIESDKVQRAVIYKNAQKTIADRNSLFLQLNAWWQNYKIALRFLFRDDPQQLEAFLIKAYSPGYDPNAKKEPDESGETPIPTPTPTTVPTPVPTPAPSVDSVESQKEVDHNEGVLSDQSKKEVDQKDSINRTNNLKKNLKN